MSTDICEGMKYKVIESNGCSRTLQIEVSPVEVDRAYDETYKTIAKTARIHGFRPGHAPENLVRVHYAKEVSERALKRLVADSYWDAVKEGRLEVIGAPEIEEVKFKEGEPLEFIARFEVKPEVRLENYRGMKVKMRKAEVKDEEINQALVNLQEVSAQFIAVEARPAKEGDFCIADIECFVEGKSAYKWQKTWVELSERYKIKELALCLVGTSSGQVREITAKLTEEFGENQNKEAKFKAEVKEIKEKRIPPLDDEFAKDQGQFENLEALKIHIKRLLQVDAERKAKLEMGNDILEELLKDTNFALPDSWVERQTNHLLKETQVRLLYRGVKKEEIEKEAPALKEKISHEAVKQLKTYCILDYIASKENLVVSDEDVSKRVEELARLRNEKPAKVRSIYQKDNLLEGLKDEIREMKVREFLLKEAALMD